MCCTPDMVEFGNNGEEIYVKKTDCPLVKHWARKYQARVKVAWIPKLGPPLLFDFGVEHVAFMAPGSEVEKGDMVWAVPSSTMGVLHDASLIKRLVSAVSVEDYYGIRRNLSEAGYPDDILDVVPSPR